MCRLRLLSFVFLLSGTIVTVDFAAGQSNPTRWQWINELQPDGQKLDTSGPTAGIRPSGKAPTSGAVDAPSAPRPQANTVSSIPVNPSYSPPPMQRERGSALLNFATGSAELNHESRIVLNELGVALSSAELASYRFRIEGHTDTVGSPAANRVLSERRAASVRDYLMMKFNIRSDRLEITGLGDTALAIPTPPQTPERLNRRVKIINIGG
jgi:OOP family OmpA-OmpF porin